MVPAQPRSRNRARAEAEQLRDNVTKEAQNKAKEIELAAKQEQMRVKEKFEREHETLRRKLEEHETRIAKREDTLDRKLDTLSVKEKNLDDLERRIAQREKAVVAKDEQDESVSLLAELCPPGVDLVMSGQAWSDYEVPGSPYVVVVDGPTGRVKGEGSGTSFSQLSALVAQAAGDASARDRKPGRDTERESDVDRELMRAGIMPGDVRLYQGLVTDDAEATR